MKPYCSLDNLCWALPCFFPNFLDVRPRSPWYGSRISSNVSERKTLIASQTSLTFSKIAPNVSERKTLIVFQTNLWSSRMASSFSKRKTLIASQTSLTFSKSHVSALPIASLISSQRLNIRIARPKGREQNTQNLVPMLLYEADDSVSGPQV